MAREKSMKVGVEIIDRTSSFGALGVQGEQGARERAVRAVAEHINDTGGMGGRTLEVVTHLRNDTSGTFESQAQTSCSTFAEDHKVNVVVSGQAGGQEVLVACLARYGIPTIVASIESYDDAQFERYATLYAPAKASGSRWGFYPESLAARRLFAGGTLGIVRFGSPSGKRIRDVVVDRLTALGVGVEEELVLTNADSVSGLSGLSAQINSGILQFRDSGVDRVMFVATSGSVPFFFLPQAESQGYRPRYGFTSDEFLNFLKDNAPAAQLRGAQAVGWWPIYDVEASQDPGERGGDAFCREAFRKAGISFPDRLSEGYALSDCDMLTFAKAVSERAPRIDEASFRSATVGLGDAYASAATFSTWFGPGRRDGPSTYRPMAFDDECTCWTYSGASTQIT